MSPIAKANTESSDANRDLILSFIESQVRQSRVTINAMRNIADSFTEMTDELEAQQAEIEQKLNLMADELEVKAANAFRKRAGRALLAGAARLRNLINEIG